MTEKSTRIALGGVFSSLCLLLMFLASMVPFSSIAMPMLAGAALAVVVIENGPKTAILVYISVSLTSLFVVPDFEAKLMFISFFGYYTVLKPFIERIPNKMLVFFLKLLVFNVTVVLGYLISLKFFGLGEAAQDSKILGKYMPSAMLTAGNITFLMYDFLLTRYISIYINWFKPTFLRR